MSVSLSLSPLPWLSPRCGRLSCLPCESRRLWRRSAQYRKRYAAKGGECRHKAASAHMSPLKRRSAQFIACAIKCRHGAASAHLPSAVAALSGATLARVRSSKKSSFCQGQAAFGGCYANLDSLPSFCKGLEAARVEGDFCAICILCPSPTPRSPSRARARLTGWIG